MMPLVFSSRGIDTTQTPWLAFAVVMVVVTIMALTIKPWKGGK